MRPEKIQIVEEVSGVLKDSAFLYFVTYKGLKVKDFSAFRDELAKLDADCTVLKNRLITKAAIAAELTDLAEFQLKGDTAMISGTGDAGAVAKVVKKFAKEHEALSTKGGYVEGAVLSVAEVENIADLPSKEVLQSMLLGTLQAPSRNLVSLLNNAGAQIVNVLSNYKDKLEK